MSLTVLTNAFLIDCTGADPKEGAAVVVEDDRIRDVLPGGKDVRAKGGPGALPGPVTTIDCGGATLMPGLTDAHVHICAVTENITDQHRFYPPSYIAARAMQRAHECLMQGFTTVRDAGGADYGFRMVLEEGHFPGPRLLVSGQGAVQLPGAGTELELLRGHRAGLHDVAVDLVLDLALRLRGIRAAVVDRLLA